MRNIKYPYGMVSLIYPEVWIEKLTAVRTIASYIKDKTN